jgi:hypothetical protein
MEAASTSKTSVNIYQTERHNIPENNHLHTRHRENLKSRQNNLVTEIIGYESRKEYIVKETTIP